MFVEVWFFCCYCLCLRWILTILNTNKTHLVCTNRDQSTDRSVAWCVCVCAVSSVDGIISSQLNAQSQSQPSKCAIHSSTLVHGNWCFCCQFNFEINGKHKYVFVYIYLCSCFKFSVNESCHSCQLHVFLWNGCTFSTMYTQQLWHYINLLMKWKCAFQCILLLQHIKLFNIDHLAMLCECECECECWT